MFVKTWRDSFKVLYNESEIINRNKLILIVANVKKLCLLKQELYSVLIMINVKTVTVEREREDSALNTARVGGDL